MPLKRFKLVGLKSPGTVNLERLGTINLQEIDDELAAKLFEQGVPFIQPVVKKKKALQKYTTDQVANAPEKPASPEV